MRPPESHRKATRQRARDIRTPNQRIASIRASRVVVFLGKKAPKGEKRHDKQIDWHLFHRFCYSTVLNLDLDSTIPVAALCEHCHWQCISPKRCAGCWALNSVFLAFGVLVSQNDSVAMVAWTVICVLQLHCQYCRSGRIEAPFLGPAQTNGKSYCQCPKGHYRHLIPLVPSDTRCLQNMGSCEDCWLKNFGVFEPYLNC
jgi:hypothetical protein